VNRGYWSGVFSADCDRPAPEMVDDMLAHISSTSSYSNTAPGMHRVAYTQDDANVPVVVSNTENKDPRASGPDFSATD
jgi:hypothetical protein